MLENSNIWTYSLIRFNSTTWPTNESPKFVLLGDWFKETGETFNKISWTLDKLEETFTPKKWTIGDIYWFKASLSDWNEKYVIQSTINKCKCSYIK